MTSEQDRAQMEAGLSQAIDDFMSYDEWQEAAREAVWKWMFERGWNERNKKVMELQARIDELMLEHCPKEVTAEQIAEYAKHQKCIRTLNATWEKPTL